MAAKKTAKKTTEATPAPAPAPVAKKAAKKTAKKATKEAKPAASAPKKSPAVPKVTTEAIARVAYLNYRRRVELGLPGDSHTDWVEAERQLSSGKA